MPRVRAAAGNENEGHGCFTESKTVAHRPFPNRHPTFWSRIETRDLVDDVARAMIRATKDKREGRPPDPERAF